MSRITQRVPMLLSAGLWLTGAMMSGAVTTYASVHNDGNSVAAYLGGNVSVLDCSYVCDNSEDCGDGCKCNNSTGCVD